MTDIGNMTYGIRANVADLFQIWMEQPWCRPEFKKKEIEELRESMHGLFWLLREINKVENIRAERAKVVSHG